MDRFQTKLVSSGLNRQTGLLLVYSGSEKQTSALAYWAVRTLRIRNVFIVQALPVIF